MAKILELQLHISHSNEYSGLISFKVDRFDFLVVQGTQESSPTPQFESFHSSALSLLHGPILTFIHDKCKKHSCDYTDIFLVFNKITSLLFNTRSKFVIGFLPRSKNPLISSLKSLSTVILESKRTNVSLLPLSPFYLTRNDGTGCHDLSFLMLSYKPDFSLSSFILMKRLFHSSSLSAMRVVSSIYLRLIIFP